MTIILASLRIFGRS